MNLTEKYRPKKFDEMVGQEQIVEKLKGSDLSDLQHLLLTGRAGIGKTTTGHILKRKHLGEKSSDFLEMNASSENSIDDIRGRVQNFVKTKAIGGGRNILFLDEADNISKDGQQALRRIMEEYSDNCLFILSGNYEDQFIDPIKSRCMHLEYRPISDEDIKKRLKQICEEEGIKAKDEDLMQIAKGCNGDIREAINSLWFSVRDGEVQTPETPKTDMEDLIENLLNGQYISAKEEKDDLLRRKTEPRKFIENLYSFIDGNEEVDPQKKVIWFEELADADWRMQQDTIKPLQLERLVWNICRRTNDEFAE